MAPKHLLVVLILVFCWENLMAQHSAVVFHWPQPYRAAVSLTFDDARASQLDNGIPLFDALKVKATFYVLPGRIQERLAEWRQAAADGHEIGSHSVNHPCTGNFAFARDKALEDHTLAMMHDELMVSKMQIQDLLGIEVHSFAYPCGQTYVGRGKDVRSYVPLVAENYRAGRLWLSEDSNDPAYCDLAQLLAVEFDGLSFTEMQALVDKAVAEGRWLVFAGHDIGPPARQTTRLDDLRRLCQYLNSKEEVWLATVADVADYLQSRRVAD
jgi:peptidoglycan/xylan/chitin deacetylase (PgdA/CDA1 family)